MDICYFLSTGILRGQHHRLVTNETSSIQIDLILVLASRDSEIIEEYSLSELRTHKDVLLLKTLPTYSYTIPENFDMDFSDKGDLVYITAVDKNMPEDQDSVIMVYRAGLPAVSSFFDVFHLYRSHKEVLIDATGSFADYVGVAAGSIFMMFRQYEIPLIVFEDPHIDFTFNITYTNHKEQVPTSHGEFKCTSRGMSSRRAQLMQQHRARG